MDLDTSHNNPQQQPAPYHSQPDEKETQASYTTNTERETSSDMQTGKNKPSQQHTTKDTHTTSGKWPSEDPKTDDAHLVPEPISEGYDQNALADIYYQKRGGDTTPNYLASVSSTPKPESPLKSYQKLVAITRSSDKLVSERITAIRELANYGQFITPNILMLAMIDPDKFVRVAVLETCAELALHIPVKLVESALADSSWTVRATAVWALSHFGDTAPRKHIATIADDKNESILVRFWALYALGKLRDLSSTDRFLAILNNSKTDEHLREAAATALGLLGSAKSPLTLQLLRHTLGNEEENALVRIAAAHSLAQLSNPPEEETLLTLTKALHNKDQDIIDAANHALDVIAQQVVISINKQSRQQSNPLVISALMMLRNRIPEEVLVNLLSHANHTIRKAALDVLTTPDEALPVSNQTVVYLYNHSTLSTQNEWAQTHGVHKMGKGSFILLNPEDLKDAGISQALDGRWIPRSILRLIMSGRLTAYDIRAYLAKQVRAEYIRSLLHNRSVAIAFTLLYSSPVLFQDFLEGSSQRAAFAWLLNTGAIIPVLPDENDPNTTSDVVRSVVGLEAWKQVCQEVRMACIRLSTVEPKALQIFKRLVSSHILNNTHTIAELAQDQPETQRSSTLKKLYRQLRELAHFVEDVEQNNPSPEDLYEALYKKFVIVADSSSRERMYDDSKYAANEIKQVIDLAYNASIADALGCHLLTPGDTLPRAILQEWRTPLPASTVRFTLIDLRKVIEQCHFEPIRPDWYLKSLRFLSLQDVVEIRTSREWKTYIQSVETLMAGKSLVQNGLDTLVTSLENTYDAYKRLLEEINNMLAHRRTASSQHTFWTKWTPTPELQINIGGALFLTQWTQDGRLYSYAGNTAPDVDQQPALSISFSIGEYRHTPASTDLSISFDLLHGRLDTSTLSAHQQWQHLKNQLYIQPSSQLQQSGFVKTGPTLS